MKKVVLLAFLFAVLGSSFILSQEKPPFSWRLDKHNQAYGLFTSKTFDEVWLAAKKAMQTASNITSSDKETGIFSTPGYKFFIETKPEGVTVNITSPVTKEMYSFKAKPIFKKIYESIAVNLYGEDVLKKKK